MKVLILEVRDGSLAVVALLLFKLFIDYRLLYVYFQKKLMF